MEGRGRFRRGHAGTGFGYVVQPATTALRQLEVVTALADRALCGG